jgi:hypothetical protein
LMVLGRRVGGLEAGGRVGEEFMEDEVLVEVLEAAVQLAVELEGWIELVRVGRGAVFVG